MSSHLSSAIEKIAFLKLTLLPLEYPLENHLQSLSLHLCQTQEEEEFARISGKADGVDSNEAPVTVVCLKPQQTDIRSFPWHRFEGRSQAPLPLPD
jgi:hypothetical protein